MSAHVLLTQTTQGEVVAVRFPSLEAAREWEDANEDHLSVVGCVPVVTRKGALSWT